MRLKTQLIQNIEQTRTRLEDYTNILKQQEVQSKLEVRQFVEYKIEKYKERLEMFVQCLYMYEYLEKTVSIENLKKILQMK